MAKKSEEPLLLSFTIIRNYLLTMLERVSAASMLEDKVLLQTRTINDGPWGELSLVAAGLPLSVIARASSEDQASGTLIHCQGACVIKLKDLRALIGAMPDDLLDIEVRASGKLTITPVGRADKPKRRSFTVYTLKAEDYPPVPAFPAEQEVRQLPGSVLAAAIDRVKYASDTAKAEDVHSGVLLVFGKDELTAVATNRHSLAVSKVSAKLSADGGELLLPRSIIAPAAALALSSDTISMTQDQARVYIETEAALLTCMRHVGEFPPWRMVVDALTASTIKICTLDSLQLGEAVRAVSTLFRLSYMTGQTGGEPVGITVKQGKLRVSTGFAPTGDELAGAGEEIDVSAEQVELERLLEARMFEQSAMAARGMADLRTDPNDEVGHVMLVSADGTFVGITSPRRKK